MRNSYTPTPTPKPTEMKITPAQKQNNKQQSNNNIIAYSSTISKTVRKKFRTVRTYGAANTESPQRKSVDELQS